LVILQSFYTLTWFGILKAFFYLYPADILKWIYPPQHPWIRDAFHREPPRKPVFQSRVKTQVGWFFDSVITSSSGFFENFQKPISEYIYISGMAI